LGDGWTGLAKFEFKADTTDNNTDDTTCTITDSDAVNAAGDPATITCESKAKASLTGREAMVGLKGPIGQIELGQLKQAYKYTGGVNYDIFVTTMLEARGNGGMTAKPIKQAKFGGGGHSAFHGRAVGYRNAFGPVHVSLTYGPSLDDGSMTASALYAQGGIEAFVAISDSGDLGGTGNSFSATKVGGKFTTGAHTIMAQIENTDEEIGGTTTSPTYQFLAYQMKMGPNIFALSYGANDQDKATTDNDLTYLAAGVVHKMSKMTRVYGGYRSTATDGADNRESVITIGLRKDF
jgi:hypothetical protein